MIAAVRRWYYVIRTFKNHNAMINRRAKVEDEMWKCIRGKAPFPDKVKLVDWARRLGSDVRDRREDKKP